VGRDCEFLEQEKIMDYSLLVGVHFKYEREKLLTEGWSLSHKWISNIVIENLNKFMAW
jgi:1-phosphatidylinositol-4-phosphate 5-kinase